MSLRPLRGAAARGRGGIPMREAPRERYDFHSHTFLSDGETAATDMWTAADRLDHAALAITDHIALEDPRPLLRRLHAEARAFEGGPLLPVVGVEISMVPPRHIASVARRARRAGAEIVIVYGETLVEPVPEGTNWTAIESGEVDLLAHPGLLTEEDARRTRDQEVVLEISTRRGHSLTNGIVAQRALQAGAEMVVDSDAHRPQDLVDLAFARRVARGSGIPPERLVGILREGPRRLLRRLGKT